MALLSRRAFACGFTLALLAPRLALGEELPASRNALLLLKVLAYDRKLEDRVDDVVRVLVVYRKGDRESEGVRSELANALEAAAKKLQVSGLPVHIESREYSGSGELSQRVGNTAALYVCPGLSSSVDDIAKVTRKRKVLSFSGTEQHIRDALSVGLVLRGKKPTVLVNLPASRHEGAKLDAALLRVAEVVGR